MKPFPHRARLTALLLANLALLAALAAGFWFDNVANRGRSFSTAPQPIGKGEGPTLGVNLYNIHLEPDPDAVRRSMALARALGARYARMQAPWDDIEIHGRGDFEDRRNVAAVGIVSAWAKYDRIVAEANAAGVELIVRLERPPVWARERAQETPQFQAGLQQDGNSTGPPDDFADYGAFVAAVVERYDGDGLADAPAGAAGPLRLRFFQLWNEPNLKNEWGWEDPKPEDFVALLRTGYQAAKGANSNAVLLFPGLAPTDGLDPRAPMTELQYLERVYQAGGAAYFDIMAAQAYGLGQPPDEHRFVFLRGPGNWSWRRPIDTRNDVSRVVLLREVMERNGDQATPVWITEFGWNSAPPSVPPERRRTWGQPVSEEIKGAYLVGQMQRARDEWPWMGVMNVWMLRYGGYAEPDPADPTPYFALVSRDWRPLPAYAALQAYSAAPAVAGVGAHFWSHPAVEPIEGGWRLRFVGTRLTLVGGLAGGIEPVLDGQPVALERDGLDGLQTLSTADLPDGEHTLEIRGAPAPERFLVLRARPFGWLWDGGPLVLLAALVGLGAATMVPLWAALVALWVRAAQMRAQARERGGLVAQLLSPGGLTLAGLLLGAAIAYRASPQLPLTLGGLAIVGLLALRRPDLALLLVPLGVPLYFIPKTIFDTRFGVRESGLALPLHELLLLIALAAAGVGWVASRREQAAGRRQEGERVGEQESKWWRTLVPIARRQFIVYSLLPVVCFLLAGVWGVAVAGARGPALRELRWLFVEPLLFVGLLAVFVRLYRAIGAGVDYGLRIVQFWLVGGAVAGLVGLLQFGGLNLVPLFGAKVGFSEDSFLVEGVRRVSGLYGHPNNLGLAMGRYWPVAAALAHAAFWGAANHKQGLRRAGPYLLATVLCGGGLLVSFSRGAYGGAVVAGALLAVALLPRRLWPSPRVLLPLAALGALALLSLGALVALYVERFNLFGASSGIRLSTWASGLAMLRDHPLGIGLDQFAQLYPRYIDPALASTNEINTAHPHNLLLDIPLRLGPLGVLAFGWLLARFYRSGLRNSGQPDGQTLALRAGLLAAMTAALVHGLVDQFYFWPDLAFAFWLFVALAWPFSQLPEHRSG